MFDPRIESLFLPRDLELRHWCFPWYTTYTLRWSRHGTLGDTSLKTLELSSSGTISVRKVKTKNGTENIASLVEELILKDHTDRLLVICFEPWDRLEGLGWPDDHEPAIEVETYLEEEEDRHQAASIVKGKTENGPKLVFVLISMNGSSNLMMKTIDSMSDWSTITILGTQQMSRFLDWDLNHTTAIVPKVPCPEEQLDQLSWVRRSDTKVTVIITGKDPLMLHDNWRSFIMDDRVRKVLFPKRVFEKRLVKIENDKMAGFFCAVVALDAIFGIHAPTVINMMGLRTNARVATVKSLRYQGILNESPGTESEPMRLRLEELAKNEQQSQMLFLRLMMAFEYDHKLALMVYKSLSSDQDTRILTILVACILKLGLEELILTEQIVKVTQTDGGLETLLKMCTGPFRKLAKTGTLWLKLALMHKVVWVDGELGLYYDDVELPKLFKSIVHVGNQERPIEIPCDAYLRLDRLIRPINKVVSSATGETRRPGRHWSVLGIENTLRGVQRHVLDGHILEVVLSRPRTTPSSVLGIRSQTTLEFRHKYMGDMAANIARDLPPESLDMFGIALSIPVLDSSTFYIDEWISIPLQIVLSWHDLHHGKDEPLLDGLVC
ncbi:unnamed protein product [Clonostachys solani]|uniref:Uncharacterized protein n=1 Tax=Clonostachys solani TaxID=160281 RepID=A0A9N9W0Z1_9HYPO|nr:unnamed protein product [Clonostachys solani]